MAVTKKNPRTARLSAIHVLKSKLRLDTDTYRALLVDVTGYPSAGDEGQTQTSLARVLDRMRALERELVSDAEATPEKAQGTGWMDFDKDDEPMVRKIKAQWVELGKMGRVERTTVGALNAWVKRQTGVDAVRWLQPKQQRKLIEELKRWIDRD